MREFLIALQFLTRTPLNLRRDITQEELPRSMLYYPVIGLAIGLVLVLVNVALSRFLPPSVVNIIILVSLILITGGLHLDGFTDTVDGLYAGKTRDDILRIMKDSHIGAMGTVGLVCLLLFKFVLLENLPKEVFNSALVLMPVFGRWAMVVAAAAYPYARSEGTGKPFVKRVRLREWLGATLIAVAIGISAMKVKGVILFLMVFVAGFALAAFINKRIGGMTGDTLGAIGEAIEAFVLLGVCVLSPTTF